MLLTDSKHCVPIHIAISKINCNTCRHKLESSYFSTMIVPNNKKKNMKNEINEININELLETINEKVKQITHTCNHK